MVDVKHGEQLIRRVARVFLHAEQIQIKNLKVKTSRSKTNEHCMLKNTVG